MRKLCLPQQLSSTLTIPADKSNQPPKYEFLPEFAMALVHPRYQRPPLTNLPHPYPKNPSPQNMHMFMNSILMMLKILETSTATTKAAYSSTRLKTRTSSSAFSS